MTAHVDPNAAHAVFSPSGAPTWTVCTASAEAIAAMRRVVPEEEREESQDGTAGHDEIERRIGPLQGELVDPATMPIKDIDPEHAAAYGVALFVDFIRKLPPGRMWVEQRVILTKDIWGRADTIHWHEESLTLTIPDYKNGFVGVDPDSEQLQIYAGAAMNTFGLKAKWVRLVVVQPNDFRPLPRIKQQIFPADEVLTQCAKWAAIPGSPKTFVGVGEHCRDCALFGTCEPSKDVLAHFGTMIAKGVEGVPAEMIAKFTACKKPIDHFFEAMAKRGTKLATAGNVPPGMVLVTGTTRRAWKDEAAARAAVLAAKGVEALLPPTPAQVEEMGIDIEALADKLPGGPVLAMEGDKRKPWAPKSAAEMFAGVAAQVGEGAGK